MFNYIWLHLYSLPLQISKLQFSHIFVALKSNSVKTVFKHKNPTSPWFPEWFPWGDFPMVFVHVPWMWVKQCQKVTPSSSHHHVSRCYGYQYGYHFQSWVVYCFIHIIPFSINKNHNWLLTIINQWLSIYKRLTNHWLVITIYYNKTITINVMMVSWY